MATLATVDDVETRIGRPINDEDELARVNALLKDASAAVRHYTRREFGAETVTRRFRPLGGFVKLRDNVTDVSEVKSTASGTAIGFAWDGIDRLATTVTGQFDMEPNPWPDAPVDVTYSFDNGPVPDIIVAVTANMAARAFGVKADDAAKTQESIAGYSYTLGATGAAGPVGMLPAEQAVLDPYRRVGGTAWVSIP